MNNELMITFSKQIEKKIKRKIEINDRWLLGNIEFRLSNVSTTLANNVAIAADYFFLKEGWAATADIEVIPAVINGDNARIRFFDKETIVDVIFSLSPVFTKIVWLSIPIYRAKRFFGIDLGLDIDALVEILDIDERNNSILSVLKEAIAKRSDFAEDLILEYLPTNAYIITENAEAISIEKLDVYNTDPQHLLFSDVHIKDNILISVYRADFVVELEVDDVSEIKDDIQLTCKLFRKDGKRSLII